MHAGCAVTVRRAALRVSGRQSGLGPFAGSILGPRQPSPRHPLATEARFAALPALAGIRARAAKVTAACGSQAPATLLPSVLSSARDARDARVLTLTVCVDSVHGGVTYSGLDA